MGQKKSDSKGYYLCTDSFKKEELNTLREIINKN